MAAMLQHPRLLWNRQKLLSYYQNWTIYRIALGALNLRHPGWTENQGSAEDACKCSLETVDHIIWDCLKAKLAWKGWLDQWLGYSTTPTDRERLQAALASPTAPSTPMKFLVRAQQCVSRWTTDHDAAMATL
ncbi:hypothetical protein PI125_g24572 [Phytophthora idaei]|nr:hypothetical protein PI125_g24572 [Phytophthora idaei]KAG3124846.1 hypothetical protein PI126_g23059 [Phytophthora idaei]